MEGSTMRLLVVMFGAFLLMCYVMVVAGCSAPAVAAPKPGPIAVERSFAGCTPEPDGRQQCCYTAVDRDPICVFTAAPRRAANKIAKVK
jgi:hypothetical protein